MQRTSLSKQDDKTPKNGLLVFFSSGYLNIKVRFINLGFIKVNQKTNHTETELLKRFYEGDAEAFETIFKTYWYPLFKIANARLKSSHNAEEVVQDIFAALWKNRSSVRIGNLSFYLFSAVRKRSLNTIRSQIVDQKYRDYYIKFFTASSLATEEAVDFNELKETIEKALLQLPQKSQQVFRLNRLQGLSVPEISVYLKTPERTIEHHLARALRELRLNLRDLIVSVLFFISAC